MRDHSSTVAAAYVAPRSKCDVRALGSSCLYAVVSSVSADHPEHAGLTVAWVARTTAFAHVRAPCFGFVTTINRKKGGDADGRGRGSGGVTQPRRDHEQQASATEGTQERRRQRHDTEADHGTETEPGAWPDPLDGHAHTTHTQHTCTRAAQGVVA